MEEQEIKVLGRFLSFPLSQLDKSKKAEVTRIDVTVSAYCRSLLTFGKMQRLRANLLSKADIAMLDGITDEWFAEYKSALVDAVDVVEKYGLKSLSERFDVNSVNGARNFK